MPDEFPIWADITDSALGKIELYRRDPIAFAGGVVCEPHPQCSRCKYPPAEPGALGIGPLEAAVRVADAALHSFAT
jgi:hypothetical protein